MSVNLISCMKMGQFEPDVYAVDIMVVIPPEHRGIRNSCKANGVEYTTKMALRSLSMNYILSDMTKQLRQKQSNMK